MKTDNWKEFLEPLFACALVVLGMNAYFKLAEGNAMGALLCATLGVVATWLLPTKGEDGKLDWP